MQIVYDHRTRTYTDKIISGTVYEIRMTCQCILFHNVVEESAPNIQANLALVSIVEELEYTPSVRDTSQHIPSPG